MKFNFWYLSSLSISLIVAIPILTVFTSFFQDTSNYFEILKQTFFFEYIFNSLTLLIGVLFLTFILGVGSAYVVSFYQFPGANFFKWALILSFAVPPYIYAYSLFAFFENYGTAFTILKHLFGDGDYNKHIPKFSGMFGLILSISFSLYAYVYILARSSFLYQSQNLIELGKNLGFSKFKSFYSIILPAARPAIVAGLSLVAMETLAEFGLFIFILFLTENLSRKKARYHLEAKGGFKKKEKIKLNGAKSFFAFIFCFTLFFLSFLFPLSQMLYWTIKFPENLVGIQITDLLLNTLYLVSLSSLVLLFFALISNYGNRVSNKKILNALSIFSISGYAIPGVILAIAFITFIAWFDENLIKALGFLSIKKIFIGSILGLVIVYFVRFYSLAFNGIKSGYEKMNIAVDESAYLLGYSKTKTFLNIHIPYLRNSLLFVIILISLEIIRELPITLILRPFNFETFATTAYISASEDLLEAAAVPSLCLIIIASFFILLTSKYILRDSDE